jgi:hypothetical protein
MPGAGVSDAIRGPFPYQRRYRVLCPGSSPFVLVLVLVGVVFVDCNGNLHLDPR